MSLLKPLPDPASVALIGACTDPAKDDCRSRLLLSLRGFACVTACGQTPGWIGA